MYLSSPSFAQSQPNIIFVFLDDMAAVGELFGGNPQVLIPNFERLAERGVNFTNGFCNGAVCATSRASALTGTQIYRNGYYGYSMALNSWMDAPNMQGVTDIFSHFKNNGYQVYAAGKMFHGGDELPGFFTELYNAGTLSPYAWDGVSFNGNSPVLFPHPSMPSSFVEPSDGIAPLSDIPTIGNYTGWINRDGTPFMYVNDDERSALVDENVLQYACAKLSSTPPGTPFFLTLGIQKPHLPFYLPKKYFDLYPIEEIELPPILDGDLLDIPIAFLNNRANNAGGYSGNRAFEEASADSSDTQWWLKRHLQGYYAGVSYVDELLGQLLDSLDASPHAGNTYLILASDHGYHFGEKSVIKKSTLWDAVTKIPFIIAGPGVVENTSVSDPVSLVDLFPTFIDLAGLPSPEHLLDGYSLRPLIEAPGSVQWEGHEFVITGIGSNEKIPVNTAGITHHQHHCIRTINRRYVLYATGEEELYDLDVDPNEWFNMAGDPAYAPDLAALRAQLEQTIGTQGLVPPPEVNETLNHGSFEQNINGWQIVAPAQGDITIETSNPTHGEKYLSVPSSGSTRLYNSNLNLSEGETYLVSFSAFSSVAGSSMIIDIGRNGEPDTLSLYSYATALTEGWQTYSFTFAHSVYSFPWNNRLSVTLQNQSGYYLDNFRVTRRDPDGVENIDFNDALSLYPNPTRSEEVRYRMSDTQFAGASFSIYNPQGVRMASGKLQSTQGNLPIGNVSPGTYFVHFQAEGTSALRKLIIVP